MYCILIKRKSGSQDTVNWFFPPFFSMQKRTQESDVILLAQVKPILFLGGGKGFRIVQNGSRQKT